MAELKEILEKRGVRFKQSGIDKFADATRTKRPIGIDTLGKLEYFGNNGYVVLLPEVNYNSRKGYKGLSRP